MLHIRFFSRELEISSKSGKHSPEFNYAEGDFFQKNQFIP